jgi:molybdenum cofactor cytidylyltransferase
MIFAAMPLAEAEGAVLAHTLHVKGLTIRKGTVLGAAHCAALAAAGIEQVVAARLGGDDVPEDEAAQRIAAALAGPGSFAATPVNGRVNVFAETAGLLLVGAATITHTNALDEAITIATLAPFARVAAKQMLATVKIIPYAAPKTAVARAVATLEAAAPALRVAPFTPRKVALIQTTAPRIKLSVLEKTARVSEQRCAGLGLVFLGETRCAHDFAALAQTLGDVRKGDADIVLIAGASAIADRADIVPQAVLASGGTIEHLGMPVEPGNLLMLARLGHVPVIGLPGCARSPKLNGLDWVLERLAAGVAVDRAALIGMGVGGLLTEFSYTPRAVVRPEFGPPPRTAERPAIAAIVLAAGFARRMGTNKLTAPLAGTPMVRRVVEAVLASRVGEVIVVTGHEAAAVKAALAGAAVRFVEAPDYAAGLGASLARGVAALPETAAGFFVLLGDMPLVSASLLDRMIEHFAPEEGAEIVVPCFAGKQGNPVLWSRRFAAAMQSLKGDRGARGLIASHADLVFALAVEDEGVLLDADTPESFAALAARLEQPR